MPLEIKRAAVLGAGIMGAGIAAHLANAGIPTLMLDIVPDDAKDSKDPVARNRIAQSGLDKALKAKPLPAFYAARNARLVTVGNTVDDWAKLGEVDLIVEAVLERLDVKQDVYARLEAVRKPGTIVTSNTSGLPAHMLMKGRSDDMARNFLITHFFNPVRFMKLLELAAGPKTDPALMTAMSEFGVKRLGKGVVICKDSPNFIGNRIGAYGFMATVKRMQEEGYRIEEVDAILGPAMGRPKSAVFRTGDVAGLDTFLHVADNLYENLPHDPQREMFKMPDFVREMVKRGWLGDKTRQGFYKKLPGGGKRDILVLDPATMDYRPQEPVSFSSVESAKNNPDVSERVRTMINAPDRGGKLAWELTADTLLYTASVAEEIAYDLPSVDEAMRWGYAWDKGPFETWDALGVEATAKRMEAEGRTLPPLVKQVLGNGQGTFYSQTPVRSYWDFTAAKYAPQKDDGVITAASLHSGHKVVKAGRSASLLDMGDGVLLIEFHAKMNAIDDDLTNTVRAGLEEAKTNWRAIVIGNDAANFSVGANLAQVLMGAKMRQFAIIEKASNALQQTMLAMKYSEIPLVVAPAGQTLGGGAEFVMHGQKVRAAAETYIGLVEVGAGVIPAGGGCKELLVRGAELARAQGPFPAVQHAFQTIAVATVATSAYDAMTYGFIRKGDGVSWDREHLLADAKADAIAMAEAKAAGTWAPPKPPTFHLPGPGGRGVLEQVVDNLRLQGKASEHDAVVSGKLAYVLTGGNCSPTDELSEQYILDLEREAFVSLCGMPKTQDRMEALLKTGKPLRN
jgi:3-hydroxyacyl-CoA dehydrogenase